VTIIHCSFVNSTAPFGSAIQVKSSKLTVDGNETSFVNNTGTGPPLEVLSSQLNISHAVFAGTQVSKYKAAILLFESIMEYYDVHLITNDTSTQQSFRVTDDCHVYVAIDANNYPNKSTCMTFDRSNKSFPIIDLSTLCCVRYNPWVVVLYHPPPMKRR
jgi:hypothetical protein